MLRLFNTSIEVIKNEHCPLVSELKKPTKNYYYFFNFEKQNQNQ